MKKRLAASAAALTLLCMTAQGTTISVDGVNTPSGAVEIDGKLYAPVEELLEAMGKSYSYEGETLKIQTNCSEMIANVSKSVVGIIGKYEQDSSYMYYSDSTAHGTGVVIKSGGEILTNAHVVKDLAAIIVVMSDGSGYPAKIKYIDEEIDLAVIKIDRVDLTPIKFANDGEIVTGQEVVAIGTPVSFSLRNTATKGIVSGINCNIGNYCRMIQTDAAINPGNSGGPLVNMQGELVGINSNKYSRTEVDNMGFAIPLETVKYTISQFEAYGRVRRADTGISFEESWAVSYGFPTKSGLEVTRVRTGSQGEAAGIAEGDVICKVGEYEVHSTVDYNEAIKYYEIGQYCPMTIERGDEKLTVNVLLEEKEEK